MMLRAVIIDDDVKNRQVLRELLKTSAPYVQIAGEAENPVHGAEVIRQLQPDLVFLDIEMPYGNAFDLLDALSPVNFEIIFITAFSEYSLKAFRYSALDYLLKPVDAQELKEAVDKASARVNQSNIGKQVENLLHNFKKSSAQQHRIALPSREGYDFVQIDEILLCQARDAYTIVSMTDGRKYLSPKPLGDYEKILPEDLFFRVHHSYVINVNHVRKFHKLGRGGHVEMSDGTTVEVSYRRKEKFLARFGFR